MDKSLKNKGITLVSLTITIIILKILSGITIVQLTESGIFEKTKEARYKWDNAQKEEEIQIAKYNNEIDGYVDGDRENITSTEELNKKITDAINASWERTVLYNNRKITATGIYDLTDDISKYRMFIIESKNSSDGDRITESTFVVDETITDSKGFLLHAFDNRYAWFDFTQGTNKINVTYVFNEYIYRIIGIGKIK